MSFAQSRSEVVWDLLYWLGLLDADPDPLDDDLSEWRFL
jgi:hypothetical protein